MKKEAFAVVFQATGLSIEKLIRMAGENDIPLHALRRISTKSIKGQVSEADFVRLKEMADKRGWEIEKGKTIKAAALRDKLLRRWGMAVGLLLLVAVMAVALQFVWTVDVLDAGAYEGDVRHFVEEMGIRPGVRRSEIDLAQLAGALEWRYPDVAWVKVNFSGASLTIRMIEGVPVPKVESQGDPNDVIALQGGIITSMEPYAGTPLVKTGDVVRKGQVLIRGEERAGTDGEMTRVKARGVVEARVWLVARVRLPLLMVESLPTGREERFSAIETPFITLFEGAETAFEHADTVVERFPVVGSFFPVTLKRVTRYEVTLDTAIRGEADVREEAGQAALRSLGKKMLEHDDLVDKWVDYCMIEGKEMEATAVAEVIRDIALSKGAQ